MTQDEIISLAREAGFAEGVAEIVGLEGFERFYQLAFAAGAAHEREACAKLCDERASISRDVLAKSTAGLCAAAIRARTIS